MKDLSKDVEETKLKSWCIIIFFYFLKLLFSNVKRFAKGFDDFLTKSTPQKPLIKFQFVLMRKNFLQNYISVKMATTVAAPQSIRLEGPKAPKKRP